MRGPVWPLLFLLLASCTSESTDSASDPSAKTWWYPRPGTSWQWQLSGKLDTSVDAQVYDVDLFNTTAAQIEELHAAGRKVVCYYDTVYEPNRPDSAKLEPYKGNPLDGWPGQFWVDTRQPEVLDVMKARTALAKDKKCDAVEADDVDARQNDPGFPITASVQQGFIRALAHEAHRANMGFALKNDLEEIGVLLDDVDFSVNEQCFEYKECNTLKPFIEAGKAVFNAEYTEDDLEELGASVCPEARRLSFDTLIKHLDLGPERFSCR